MSVLATLINTHLTACCAPDASRRAVAARRVWAEAGQLTDPLRQADGNGRALAA